MRKDRVYTMEADADHQVRYPSILSQQEYADLEARPRYQKWGTMCPTCEDEGTYRWQNKDHDCPVDFDNKCFQWKLFRMYELSNIEDHYQRLDWKDMTDGKAKDDVDFYVDHLDNAIKRGYGLYLYSKGTGTGKTFSATHILKEAAKLDSTKVKYRGYFVTFDGLIGSYKDPWLAEKIKQTNILVIDDVIAPTSDKQKELLPRVLEQVVRYRYSADLPTIITSNLDWEEFAEHYPRCHSVLSACLDPVELDTQVDYRIEKAVGRIFYAMKHGEVPPIT